MDLGSTDKSEKVVSVRLDNDAIAKLQALAVIDDTTIGQEIRHAVAAFIEHRCSQAGFDEALKSARERQLAVLSVFDNAGRQRSAKRASTA